MIFRNSMRSVFRSRGKTALFTLLIAAITLALSLSVSVWASVAGFLDDCEDYFTTIGLVEYMGTNYPDDTGFDPAMAREVLSFDTSALARHDATILWEEPARSFGYVEGFWRTDNYVPGRMLSVLAVGNVFYSAEDDLYSAVVVDSLYSLQSEKDTILLIDGDFGTFEQGHTYLVFGEVYHGRSPLLHLRAASFDHSIAAQRGVQVPRMIDITSDREAGLPYQVSGEPLLQVAETLAVTNNSVLVSGTDDLLSLLPFHQQELYLVEGRAFTEDEYARGSRVAVISELMAARLQIGVGDSISLSAAVSDFPGIYNSYWVDDGFSFQEDFTVVGIMKTVIDKSWYAYVPGSAGVPVSPHPVGYTVGHAVIRSEEAASFSADMDPKMEGRLHLSIYDQGYSTVAEPYRTILAAAKIVTAVGVVVELAVVILFGFLFVFRQRETGETLLMLGTRKVQVILHFFFSSALIALASATAGAAAGFWLHDGIIALVARAAASQSLIDARYSNGNLTITKTLEFAPDLGWQLFLYVGAAVFLTAVLACMGFTISTFRQRRSGGKESRGPSGEHKTSRMGGGSLKFAVLSIRRGGTRSLVVPILAVSVVFFFGQLSAASLGYQEQLNAIYENTMIEGYYTDIHGKQIGNQVLNAYDVGSLYHTGMIESISISMGEPYYLIGISRQADGTVRDVGKLYVPSSGFARESLEAVIQRGPDLTTTNSIRTAPEFFYADTVLLSFMDGFDESFLTVPPDDEHVNTCVLPASFMAENGIEPGDTVRVAINEVVMDPDERKLIYRYFDLLVTGSYEKQGTEDTIYAPLSLFFDTRMIWDDGLAHTGTPDGVSEVYASAPEVVEFLQSTVFHSTAFSLTDSRDLIAFKDYLSEYGYSEVNDIGRVREFVVLRDAGFNNTVASIQQQIRYINMLYPFLYALVGIIAVVVSYLLVVSRKNEFAIMRGLGSTRITAFFSFFLEQSLLCAVGTAMGLTLWRMSLGVPAELHLILLGGFLVCFFFGSTVSILMMNRARVLTILLDRE